MKRGIINDLDLGFYTQARREKRAPLNWLTDKVLEAEEKDGRDPSEALQKHIEATQRHLGVTDPLSRRGQMAAGIACQTYGVKRELQARRINLYSDTCEKFFGPGSETDSPLWPAMLASSFIVARVSSGLADLMTFADVQVESMSVDKVRLNEAADARQMRNVGLGEDLPETSISAVETNVKMRKYGRYLRYVREVTTMTPLAVVQGFIRQIGMQRAVDETDEVLEILHAGDGESGSAVTDTTPATDATLVYNDLVKLELAFSNGYMGRVYVADATNFQTILQMSEYKDPLAARGVRTDRDMPSVPTPSGGGLIYRWQSTGSTYMAESGGRIAAVDPSQACWIARSSLLEEAEDIVRSSQIGVALSYRMAVIKGDPNCFKSLDVTA